MQVIEALQREWFINYAKLYSHERPALVLLVYM